MLPLEITQIPIQPDLEHSSDEESTVYSSDPPPSQKKNFFLESNLNLPPVESHHPLSCHSTPFYKVPPCLSHRIPLGTGRLLQNFFFSCFKTLETATLKARAAFREQRAGSPHRVFNNWRGKRRSVAQADSRATQGQLQFWQHSTGCPQVSLNRGFSQGCCKIPTGHILLPAIRKKWFRRNVSTDSTSPLDVHLRFHWRL